MLMEDMGTETGREIILRNRSLLKLQEQSAADGGLETSHKVTKLYWSTFSRSAYPNES